MRRPTKHNRYFVVLRDGKWMIRFDGAFYGPYRTRSVAVSHAIDTAQLAQGKSQVFVPKENEVEGFELVWTFGVDPYPPPRPKKAAAKLSEF